MLPVDLQNDRFFRIGIDQRLFSVNGLDPDFDELFIRPALIIITVISIGVVTAAVSQTVIQIVDITVAAVYPDSDRSAHIFIQLGKIPVAVSIVVSIGIVVVISGDETVVAELSAVGISLPQRQISRFNTVVIPFVGEVIGFIRNVDMDRNGQSCIGIRCLRDPQDRLFRLPAVPSRLQMTVCSDRNIILDRVSKAGILTRDIVGSAAVFIHIGDDGRILLSDISQMRERDRELIFTRDPAVIFAAPAGIQTVVSGQPGMYVQRLLFSRIHFIGIRFHVNGDRLIDDLQFRNAGMKLSVSPKSSVQSSSGTFVLPGIGPAGSFIGKSIVREEADFHPGIVGVAAERFALLCMEDQHLIGVFQRSELLRDGDRGESIVTGQSCRHIDREEQRTLQITDIRDHRDSDHIRA